MSLCTSQFSACRIHGHEFIIQAQSRQLVNNFWSLLHRWLQKRVDAFEQWPRALQITPGKGDPTKINSRMEKECEGSQVDTNTKHSALPCLPILQHEKPLCASDPRHVAVKPPAPSCCVLGYTFHTLRMAREDHPLLQTPLSGLKCLFFCHQLGPKLV